MEFGHLPHKVTLSTSPFTKKTHWKQSIFYSKKNVNVKKDDVLKGSIAVRKAKENYRALDIKISFHFEGKDKDDKEYNWYQLYKLH